MPRARFRWLIHPAHGEAIALSVPYCEPFIERIKREIPAWQRVWSKEDRLWFFDPAARRTVFDVARGFFELFWNSTIAHACPGAPARDDDDTDSKWAARVLRKKVEDELRRERDERDRARERARAEQERQRQEQQAAAEAKRSADTDARKRKAAAARKRKRAEKKEDQQRRPTDVPLDFFSRHHLADDDFYALKIFPWSSFPEAKAAYRTLAAKHHTDVGGDLDTMKIINVAWQRVSKHFEAIR